MRPSLFHFLLRAPIFVHHDKVVLGITMPCLKGKCSATTYYQCITGGAEESTAFLLKGRSDAVFSHSNLMFGPMLLASQFGIEGNTEVWDLITC